MHEVQIRLEERIFTAHLNSHAQPFRPASAAHRALRQAPAFHIAAPALSVARFDRAPLPDANF